MLIPDINLWIFFFFFLISNRTLETHSEGRILSFISGPPLPFSFGFSTYYKPFPLFNSAEGIKKFRIVLPHQDSEKVRQQRRKEGVERERYYLFSQAFVTSAKAKPLPTVRTSVEVGEVSAS